jgi:small subunit ribosomal protein S16
VAVKIRLKRLGKIRAPYYRVVVADSRTKRDGRVIEEIGQYHPTEHPSVIKIDSARAQYWLGVGAQPTEQVTALLKLTGDWGRFKGDKNAKSTVQVKGEKAAFVPEKKKPIVIRSKASVADAVAATEADEAADEVRDEEIEDGSTVQTETPAQVENS